MKDLTNFETFAQLKLFLSYLLQVVGLFRGPEGVLSFAELRAVLAYIKHGFELRLSGHLNTRKNKLGSLRYHLTKPISIHFSDGKIMGKTNGVGQFQILTIGIFPASIDCIVAVLLLGRDSCAFSPGRQTTVSIW